MSKVYKCVLLSIDESINVEADKSRRHNIANASVSPVATIMVKKAMLDNYFKEIITGTIIPAYRVERYKDFEDSPLVVTEDVPKYGCYIKYNVDTRYERYLGDDLVLASADELESYINSNSREDLSYKLASLIYNAERYYQDALKKGKKSDEYRVKKLLKSLGK